MKKRILSILLILCMVLVLVPATAFAEEPTPMLAIHGADTVCAQQDYEFTVAAPEGVTLDTEFGYDTGMMGSSAELTIDKDGVGHGVMSADWYDLDTNRFTLTAHGKTADEATVTVTKTVQVSQEHIYVDGVCGCGAVLQYTVQYDGGAEFGLYVDFKTHGQDLTLLGETFKRDGYVQTGWVDKESGAVYDLGDVYTTDADVTLNPVWDRYITVTAPFTTTVKLGDAGEPGETTFTLAVLDANTGEENYANVTVSGFVTTNGAGDYNGTLTFTGPERQLWYMLSEGAFVQQVDDGAEGWTVDATVYGLIMSQVAAYSLDDAAQSYTLLVVPAVTDDDGNYFIDWDAIDWEQEQTGKMTFTNTYSAHVYALNHDANGHWDECACGDTRNEEPHEYGDWTVTKEATQTAKGEKEHTCAVCGYTEKAEIEKLAATDTTTPQTGDSSHMALWMALLFVSAAGVIGTTVYGKKKKAK